VVENRVGAAGNAGVDYVVRAQPDGYTLLYSAGSTIVMNPHLYKYDRAKELIPVAAWTSTVLPLVVRPGLPIQSVKDLIAYGRANPGKLNFGSSGVGSPLHIAAELFTRGAGFTAVHVPFPGSAQTVNALLAGDVDFAFDAGVATPHVKAGKLRYIAVTDRRSDSYPGLPTILETAGFPVEVSAPGGGYAPPGTPAEIVNRLNLEIGKIVRNEKFKAALSTINSAPPEVFMSPQEFAKLLQSETERFGKVIRDAGIKSE
jgi:tripartite-type tricarboxylate transporter receptor subunit TctC